METLTENGAPTYENFSDKLVNAWFKLSRNSSDFEVEQLITEAYEVDKLNTWKMVCAFRNFREIGKGERELFVKCLKVMAKKDADNFLLNYNILMQQGRLDDFYKLGNYFLQNYSTISDNEMQILEQIVLIYTGQFKKDKMLMEQNKEVSLLAKWADHQKGGIGMSILITYYLGLLGFSRNVKVNSFRDVVHFIFGIMKFPVSRETNVKIETHISKSIENMDDSQWRVVKSFNYALGEFRKQYLSPLNKYLHTLEIAMCDKSFELSETNITRLPALAVKKYQKYFARTFPETFLEISKKLISGELKIKGVTIDLANFAKEYFKKKCDVNPIVEGQFESLLEHLFSHMITTIEDGYEFVVSCPVSDISGSMCLNNKGVTPLYVCALMSIIMMKLNILEHYDKLRQYTARDMVDIVMGRREMEMEMSFYVTHGISFSETPQFYEIPFSCNSLRDCINVFMNQPIGYSTDFYSVFNLIKQLQITQSNHIPNRVIAFTDGQFDMQTKQPFMTTIKNIRELFDGEPPELVYWNISTISGHKTTDDSENTDGYSALSGYNPNLMQVVLFNERRKQGEKEKINPKDMLMRVLNHEAFKGVKVV